MPRDPRPALLLVLWAPIAAAAPDEDPAPVDLSPPPAAATPADTRPAHTFRATFGDALQMQTDRLLEGIDATEDVVFTVPAGWDILEDPTLEIAFDHSSALLPERSHLTVSVNGHPLHSVALDARNGTAGRLRVRVPRDVLQPYNHVQLRAVQHVSHHCEEPFDPSLWTRVRKESWVEMAWAPREVSPDLAALPYPFVDDTGYGPVEVAIVAGERPSPATVAAAGRVGLALGRLSPYRPIHIVTPARDVERAETHAVVIGLPQENPAIRALLGDVGLKPSQGLVAMVQNPAAPHLAVLVVTGADAEGLARATSALTGQNRSEVLAGARTIVDEAIPSDPPPPARVPRAAPARDRFTLADLGLPDQTVRGFSAPALRVPLGLEGDAVVRPGGASATIEYGYAARLDPRLSAMEIRMDGVTVRTVPLDDPDGSPRSSVSIDLPESLIRPDAVLEVVFHTFPKEFDACQYLSDRTLWATLYATSTLELDRDHVAELPDLERLRFGAWPFTLERDDGEVIVALPDVPGPEELAAGVQVAAWLGQRTGAASPALRVAPASEVSFGGSPDAHFVLVADGAPHALYDRLARGGNLVLTGTGGRQLQDEARNVLLGATPDSAYATIEETLSPANDERAVLVLHAQDRQALAELTRSLTDDERVGRLEGNVAVLGDAGSVRTLATATRHQVGSVAVGAAVRLAVRRHWMFVGMGLIGGAFVLAAARRAWARGRDGR